jgi:hypothetical protein
VLTLYDGAECDDEQHSCVATFDTVTGVIVRGAQYTGALTSCVNVWPHVAPSGFFADPVEARQCPAELSTSGGLAVGSVGWLVDASPRGPYFESVDGERVGPTAPPTASAPPPSFPQGGVPTAEAVVVVAVKTAASSHPVLIIYDPAQCPAAGELPATPNFSADSTHTACLVSFDTATGAVAPAGMFAGPVGPCSNLPPRRQDVSSPFFVDPEPTYGCPQLPRRDGLSAGNVGWLVTDSPDGPYFQTVDGLRLGPRM